jgi:hypothetical protein
MTVSGNYTIVGYNRSGKSFPIGSLKDSSGKTDKEIIELARAVILKSSLGLASSTVAGLTIQVKYGYVHVLNQMNVDTRRYPYRVR